MTPPTRREFLALPLALGAGLAGCGGGGGASEAADPTATQVSRSALASKYTGITYGFNIVLPASYAQGSTRYPVIYATDSEYRFLTLSGLMQSARLQAILINIDATSSARRWIDFTMPGAFAYFRFLTEELIPVIDASFRTDPTRRTLSGHSLSGEFAMFALYLDTPGRRAFSAIVSEEGSFWYDDGLVVHDELDEATEMERQMHDADPQLPVTLVLAGDTTGNGPRVRRLHAFFAARGYTILRLAHLEYTLGHVPMDGPAFIDALRFVQAAA
jgi:enterochelin esterase-like enzyme